MVRSFEGEPLLVSLKDTNQEFIVTVPTLLLVHTRLSLTCAPLTLQPHVAQHTEAATPGASSAAEARQVVLENGMRINAPVHVQEGDTVIIDSRDGSFVGKAG